MFTGYKTYLCALGIAVVTACQYLGYIDQTVANTLLGLLGAGAFAALRAAV